MGHLLWVQSIIYANHLYSVSCCIGPDYNNIIITHGCISHGLNLPSPLGKHDLENSSKDFKLGLVKYHLDGLVQERRNSIANALGLCLSCTYPSKCVLKQFLIKFPNFTKAGSQQPSSNPVFHSMWPWFCFVMLCFVVVMLSDFGRIMWAVYSYSSGLLYRY